MLVTANQQIAPSLPPPPKHPTALGVACGAGAALCWALGFVAARHGVTVGVSPLVLALHRYVWPGLALLPFRRQHRLARPRRHRLGPRICAGAVRRTAARAAELYRLFVCSARPWRRHPAVVRGIGRHCAGAAGVEGAVAARAASPARWRWFSGSCIIGTEALRTIGAHGVGGDLLFVAAGGFFAMFGMLVRLWRVPAMRAAAITSVLSLVGLPILLFKFDNLACRGAF